MLEQAATVVALRHNRVVVETLPRSTCDGCGVSQGCGTSVLAKTVGRKVIHFELDNTVDARIGDRLVLGLPEQAMLRGSLLIYLLPLLAMILVALAADLLLPAAASLRDLKITLLALAALGLGMLLARGSLFRHRGAYMPVILRKELPTVTGC